MTDDRTVQETDGWEVRARRVVLKTPVVTISAGPALCKRSGREKEFYSLDFPDWVNVIARTPDRQLVLIRQFRYGTERLEIEIPGGMINPGEDPVAAGCRELLEETGYAGRNGRILGKVCPNPAIQRNTCYTVLVEEAVHLAPPAFDEMEDIDSLLCSENEIREMIDSGRLNHGLVLNALMFYWRQRHHVP
ncbi:MAG: NUDIX hydrolase [Desulfopila sp.]